MQNFIVLGQVPGTQIQLTFTFWVVVSVCLLGAVTTVYLLARADIIAASIYKAASAVRDSEWVVVS